MERSIRFNNANTGLKTKTAFLADLPIQAHAMSVQFKIAMFGVTSILNSF